MSDQLPSFAFSSEDLAAEVKPEPSGFLLFRAFDILKFYPLNIFESFRGGVGIVLDDVAAGMLANILMRIILLSGIL